MLNSRPFTSYRSGIKKLFICVTLRLVEPGEKRILTNLEHYRGQLLISESTGKRGDSGLIDETAAFTKNQIKSSVSQKENSKRYLGLRNYEKLCRGEVRKQVSVLNSLISFILLDLK